MKELFSKFRDVVYIVTITLMLAGWISTSQIAKHKREVREESQNSKIETLTEENRKLKLKSEKQDAYIKENANNIDWVIRIFVDSE